MCHAAISPFFFSSCADKKSKRECNGRVPRDLLPWTYYINDYSNLEATREEIRAVDNSKSSRLQ